MKYLSVLFCASILTTCAMTAEDWKSVGAAIETTTTGVYRAYDGYNRQAHIVGYDALGNPIYRQY